MRGIGQLKHQPGQIQAQVNYVDCAARGRHNAVEILHHFAQLIERKRVVGAVFEQLDFVHFTVFLKIGDGLALAERMADEGQISRDDGAHFTLYGGHFGGGERLALAADFAVNAVAQRMFNAHPARGIKPVDGQQEYEAQRALIDHPALEIRQRQSGGIFAADGQRGERQRISAHAYAQSAAERVVVL